MSVRLVYGASIFLAVTEVKYEIGFLHLHGPEKGMWRLFKEWRKSQNWLCAQGHVASEFSQAGGGCYTEVVAPECVSEGGKRGCGSVPSERAERCSSSQ